VYCFLVALPDTKTNQALYMHILPILLVLTATVAADYHTSNNPVYKSLRAGNITGTAEDALKMPAPIMADGLTAAQQKKVLETAAGTKNLASFMRKSVTANPLKIRVEKIDGSKQPFRSCYYYYIAYGELDAISNPDFFQGQLAGARDTKVTNLTDQELSERGITKEKPDHEGYGYVTTDVIKKVELSTLGHGYWSKSEDSIIFASVTDPRFVADKKYPNQWKAKKRTSTGAASLGPAQPYSGSGIYTKVTRLKSPQGALFIETHMFYSEPKAWFNGVNLLGAKLPATIKLSLIREMRRDITAAGKKQK